MFTFVNKYDIIILKGGDTMAVISVRISDNEYKYAQQFAKFNGINVSAYLRDLLEQKIEDFEDEKMVKDLEKDMEKNPEDYNNTIPFKQFVKEFEDEAV